MGRVIELWLGRGDELGGFWVLRSGFGWGEEGKGLMDGMEWEGRGEGRWKE
jgi:hypothetical protein